MKKNIKYTLVFLVSAVSALGVYYLAAKANNTSLFSSQNHQLSYTCPMPQDSVFSPQPGVCPKCGMDLVLQTAHKEPTQSHAITHLLQPTDAFVVGDFQSTTAKDTAIGNTIKLPGLVAYDPNSAVTIAAKIGGRIEKMYVYYRFQKIAKGQKLFDLYSPELLTAQQNYLYLITNDPTNGTMIQAAKQQLVLYGMPNGQIQSLATTKRAHPVLSIYSPADGIVQSAAVLEPKYSKNTPTAATSLDIKEGDYILKNQVVFKLLNTNKVWGVFNIIPGYASQVQLNQRVKISPELHATDSIYAKINFIETQLNPNEKTNRIRVYLNNKSLKFPIGLPLQAEVTIGSVKAIWLQKQAIRSMGTQKIVFLKKKNGFKATSVQTGLENKGFIQVTQGITVRDSVAANAAYLMDSESFIKTK
ncbi:efflux RND transporter periplasmic adaptor subunit [Flavobacterium crassostreae]|uniref:Heavy metal transporter n=1 Tax=Flavobacterium crassostreae TaxID=1763534 RepID=A0A1B9DXI5_9FLAO|nr:efflux RND transporter periplasmic adaptor subunit [Flavobacterium crassostreae]OCB74403.1 heavy metal transporter [Flavobacterium crassostreae]